MTIHGQTARSLLAMRKANNMLVAHQSSQQELADTREALCLANERIAQLQERLLEAARSEERQAMLQSEHNDAEHSVLSFIRHGDDPHSFMLVVCNFTPTVLQGYRIGVPQAGQYLECLNTDSVHYGGSNTGTPLGAASAEPRAWHGRAHSILLNLPPLATVMLEWKS